MSLALAVRLQPACRSRSSSSLHSVDVPKSFFHHGRLGCSVRFFDHHAGIRKRRRHHMTASPRQLFTTYPQTRVIPISGIWVGPGFSAPAHGGGRCPSIHASCPSSAKPHASTLTAADNTADPRTGGVGLAIPVGHPGRRLLKADLRKEIGRPSPITPPTRGWGRRGPSYHLRTLNGGKLKR